MTLRVALPVEKLRVAGGFRACYGSSKHEANGNVSRSNVRPTKHGNSVGRGFCYAANSKELL